jgi:CPA2 family monovalent cation:H+ antiporter-2
MALLYSELTTRGHPQAKRLRPIIETAFKGAAALALVLWGLSILPASENMRSLLLFSGVLALIGILVLRRKLIFWHSEMEVEILSAIETDSTKMSSTSAPWLQPHGEWNLHMIDCTLPDLADSQGKTIAELDLRAKIGCSVVGIERQGFMIPLPPPETVLYPRDKVLLLGTIDQVRAGQKLLAVVTGVRGSDSVFEEVSMEAMSVPAWSRAAEKTLGDLSPARQFGVQIAGIHRGGLRVLNPSAHEVLHAGDEILVLGTPAQNEEFKAWLRENPSETLPDSDTDDALSGGL